jgi:hypothetical protein
LYGIKNIKSDEYVHQVAPRDPDLRKKLEQCEREVKRIRFEEALATPVRRPEGVGRPGAVAQPGAPTPEQPRTHGAGAVGIMPAGGCQGSPALCLRRHTLHGNRDVGTDWADLGMEVNWNRVRDSGRWLQEEKPVALELDLADMPVEDSYDGPMMEGEPI